MKRTASAVWNGSIKEGQGHLSTASGVLTESQYSFNTRFENGVGTNPEELIAAAHAGCFSMALSKVLGDRELTPDRIETRAAVTLEISEGGPSITKVHLTVEAEVPGTDAETFADAAEAAKNGCPVSQVLNADISMDARLVS